MITGMLLSTQELDNTTIVAIQMRFEAILGDSVSLSSRVDNSLIGGIRVVIDGRIYDGSLRAQLNKVGQMLSTGRER